MISWLPPVIGGQRLNFFPQIIHRGSASGWAGRIASRRNSMDTKIWIVKVSARVALGLVWLYEGLVPKILFLRADEIGLVQKSGLVWRSAQWTLLGLGIAQMLVGLWLIIGWTERLAVAVATFWMAVLIVLVAAGNGFFVNPADGEHNLRLAFSCASLNDIEQGMRILAQVIQEAKN